MSIVVSLLQMHYGSRRGEMTHGKIVLVLSRVVLAGCEVPVRVPSICVYYQRVLWLCRSAW